MRIQDFNDYKTDLLQSILWQYNESTNLVSLLNAKQDWYNIYQSQFWETWTGDVFDLTTASLFGLAVWSIILNVPLFVPLLPESNTKPIWGFNAYDPSYPTLENSYWNFYGNGSGANFSTKGQEIVLTQQEQQFLLRLKYLQLSTLTNIAGIPIAGETITTNGNWSVIYSINAFLNYLCTNNTIGYTGTIYILDGLDMSITYVFTTTDFPVYLLEALIELDMLPRPAGVGIKIVINTQTVFGFGQYYQNFGNGDFIRDYF